MSVDVQAERCGHNFPPEKCTAPVCGYRDAVKRLAGIDEERARYKQALSTPQQISKSIRHDIEIDIPSPGVKGGAKVYIDRKRVEGLFDYAVECGKEYADPVMVTLKIWPERFKLTARDGQVTASAVDPRGTRDIRNAIDNIKT
jgi:hypothetical protein